MSVNDELKGLGGWLILVGIGIVIGPIRMLVVYFAAYKPIFEDGTWGLLTTPGSESYLPYFDYLLIGEITINTILFAASVYLIYLFFSKHHMFPKLYIAVVATSLVFIPLDAWVATKVFVGEPMFDPDTTREFLRTLVSALIWIPYMLISKRVRATFVEGMPVNSEVVVQT